MRKLFILVALLLSVSCNEALPEGKAIEGISKGIESLDVKKVETVVLEYKQEEGRFTVPLIMKYGKSPRVVLSINGKPARLLVDTGASKSFINLRAYKQYKFGIFMNKPAGFVFGASGVDMPYFDVFNCKLTTKEGKVLNVRFSALDMNSSAGKMGLVGIIGIDFMRTNNVVLDFKNNVMHYGK